MKFQQALSSLRNKEFLRYALVGNEGYFKEYFIKAIKENYCDYNFTVMYPEDESDALSLLRCGNGFSDNFLILNCFDEMGVKHFGALFESYSGGVVLRFTEKGGIGFDLSDFVTVECEELRRYGLDYPSWIRLQLIKAGYEASGEIDALIYARTGPNLYMIENELEKLFLLKYDSREITEQDVRSSVLQSFSSTAFELFDYLLQREVVKALKWFYSYTRVQDNFFELVGFLGSYFEKMLRMLLFRERGFELEDIANILNIPKFLIKTRYFPRVLAFGKYGIASKIDYICDLNIKLRLFRGDKRVLFERFILSFSK